MMSFFNLILNMSCHSIRKSSLRKVTTIDDFQPLVWIAMGFMKASIRLQFILQESVSPPENLKRLKKKRKQKKTQTPINKQKPPKKQRQQVIFPE